jgi:hypothetical protein
VNPYVRKSRGRDAQITPAIRYRDRCDQIAKTNSDIPISGFGDVAFLKVLKGQVVVKHTVSKKGVKIWR